MNARELATLLSCSFFALSSANCDTLVLRSDRTVTGTVLQTNGDDIVLRTDYGTFRYSLANTKQIRLDPHLINTNKTERLPDSKLLLVSLGKESWSSGIAQIPATVIDKGVFRRVPYVSFRCGDDYEINVYGDLDHPAGIEAGVYRKLLGDPSAKANCLNFVRALLNDPADRQTLHELNSEKDLKTRDGLTFEITPPTDEDAYMAWWVSVYDEQSLKTARASDEEMKRISVAKSQPANGATLAEEPSNWSEADMKFARSSQPNTITFTNNSGEVIKDAQVVRVIDGIALVWRSGASGGVVKLAELPEDLRQQYGYDAGMASAADAAEKERKAREWQQTQLQAAQASQAAEAQAQAARHKLLRTPLLAPLGHTQGYPLRTQAMEEVVSMLDLTQRRTAPTFSPTREAIHEAVERPRKIMLALWQERATSEGAA